MPDHPFRANATDIAGLDGSALLDAMVAGTVWTLPSGANLIDYDFSAGQPPLTINNPANGISYSYDPDDSTSSADIDTLVSGDGRRYKSESGTAIGLNSVLSRTNDTPVSPSLHDAYLVGVAPTDPDWAGKADQFALYTKRGWVFAVPYVGSAIYVENIGENLQQDENGDWVPFGTSTGIATIGAQALKRPMGMSVEGIFNDPPVSPVADQFYLVGMGPTGDFLGQSNKVAYFYDSAWQFIAPQSGDQLFDKAQLRGLTYVGGWQPAAVSPLQGVVAREAVAASKEIGTGEYDVTLASFSYQGNTQRRLRFRLEIPSSVEAFLYMNVNNINPAGTYTIGIFRDSETTPVLEIFETLAGSPRLFALRPDTTNLPAFSYPLGDLPIADALAHDYHFKVLRTGGVSSQTSAYEFGGELVVEEWLI